MFVADDNSYCNAILSVCLLVPLEVLSIVLIMELSMIGNRLPKF